MKRIPAALCAAMMSITVIGTCVVLPLQPAAAALPVFDVTNYSQNLLQAARALEQINNQVKSLQNEASMLQNMAKNLQTIDFPQLQKITSAMQRIDQLMEQAQAIDFKVQGLDQQIKTLFPGALQQALTGDQRVAAARSRLDAATAAYKQAMGVQAQVAENVKEDAGVLNELAASSQGAVGALQVSQAANQLLALSVKQQLQLQNLMASEFREAALDRARRTQAEEDGRATTRRFLDGAPRN
ncbi:MAG: P-type conjugative transfer protein TrbJ [Sphingomonas sp.]|nr:P-type conjugative transfer protein TrbJ [Sphingomonas sp.]